MPDYIDIHAHVNFNAYAEDREAVVRRALNENIWMINVGTQVDTSRKAVEMAHQYDNGVYAIVGLHPIHTSKSFHDEQELGGSETFTSRGESLDDNSYRELLKDEKVVAIGECGLDYYRLEEESIKKQKEAFVRQIELANEAKKPLMLHIRKGEAGKARLAYLDAHEILKTHAKVEGDVHFFAGDLEEAKLFLDLGFTLSFTGVITFARNYDEVIKNVPLDMIMSETDCPYVTPAPYRGKRNEPLYVKEIVAKIAEIRGEDLEKVKDQLVQNARRVFGL